MKDKLIDLLKEVTDEETLIIIRNVIKNYKENDGEE